MRVFETGDLFPRIGPRLEACAEIEFRAELLNNFFFFFTVSGVCLDKFLVVVETASMNETELAEYARKKGLYVEQIKAWRDACVNANGGVAREAARLNQELKESEKERRRLEKELSRKEKALAETAALLVLRKKADAIWGVPEDE